MRGTSVTEWRKSRLSDKYGGVCVEVAQWRKSSRSTSQGGDCVEVAGLQFVIAVRDSKDPGGPKLAFDAAAWRVFARQAKSGVHDLG